MFLKVMDTHEQGEVSMAIECLEIASEICCGKGDDSECSEVKEIVLTIKPLC